MWNRCDKAAQAANAVISKQGRGNFTSPKSRVNWRSKLPMVY